METITGNSSQQRIKLRLLVKTQGIPEEQKEEGKQRLTIKNPLSLPPSPLFHGKQETIMETITGNSMSAEDQF